MSDLSAHEPATILREVSPDVRRAITDLLRADAGGSGNEHACALAAAAEIAVLLGLPQDRRREVEERLLAFWRHRTAAERGSVPRLAEEIGTGRGNVYRLMQRMTEVGPVRGLVRQLRADRRTSSTRDGFGQPLDGWIADALRSSPGAGFAEVAERIAALREGAATSGSDDLPYLPDLPIATALKRRIQFIRSRAAVVDVRSSIGARLLIDTCRLGLRVRSDTSSDWWVMAVVDVGSSMILGHDLAREPDAGSLDRSVSDMWTRLADIAYRTPVAKRIEEVDWVVPPTLAAVAETAGATLPASRRPRIELLEWEPRRPGARLVRSVGDRLGGLRLLVRGRASDEGPKAALDVHGFDGEGEARFAVWQAVHARNEEIVERLPRLGPRGRDAAQRNASAVFFDVRTMMTPVLEDRA